MLEFPDYLAGTLAKPWVRKATRVPGIQEPVFQAEERAQSYLVILVIKQGVTDETASASDRHIGEIDAPLEHDGHESPVGQSDDGGVTLSGAVDKDKVPWVETGFSGNLPHENAAR